MFVSFNALFFLTPCVITCFYVSLYVLSFCLVMSEVVFNIFFCDCTYMCDLNERFSVHDYDLINGACVKLKTFRRRRKNLQDIKDGK